MTTHPAPINAAAVKADFARRQAEIDAGIAREHRIIDAAALRLARWLVEQAELDRERRDLWEFAGEDGR